MWKTNRWMILATALVILLPMLIGIVLWDRLPQSIAVHFGTDNAPDGWASKAFAVFGLPGILLGLHLLCLTVTAADPRRKNVGKKPLWLLFWLIPILSLVVCPATYAIALGVKLNMGTVCSLLLGLLFLVLGNLLPKVKQNYTFGIKLPWTLYDPENWSRTHRFGGWCMVLAGIVLLAAAPWPTPWVMLPAILAAALAPMVYSYVFYRRHRKEEP